MNDHTYQPGDLVERISTGDRAKYIRTNDAAQEDTILVTLHCVEDGEMLLCWPASDCRPAVDHADIVKIEQALARHQCAAEMAAKEAIIADLKKLISSEASAWRAEALKWMDDRVELEAQVAKLEARNERMTQYVDDACECCRCCECQGWNPECSILATKRHKGIDIVTGEQLRAAAGGE